MLFFNVKLIKIMIVWENKHLMQLSYHSRKQLAPARAYRVIQHESKRERFRELEEVNQETKPAAPTQNQNPPSVLKEAGGAEIQ